MKAIAKLVKTWKRNARQRRNLMEMDERLLRDIGLNRSDIIDDYRKAISRR